jgi:beta-lactamase class A
MMIARRDLLLGLGVAAALPATAAAQPRILNPLATLEASVHGRLGVFAQRLNGRVLLAHREHDRFPMCSTFKASLAGAVLARVDRGLERLDRRIAYTAADLLEYAPTTRAHLAEGGLTVAALCQAAIQLSDNTAANLLLASVGGPATLTRFWRSIGDPVTRLDRNEPALNEATPGDQRDTTTPAAMAGDLRALLFGQVLTPGSRAQLTQWMLGATTGAARLHAGVPASWRQADKTGTGALGSTNDIAVFWLPHGQPLIVAAYLTESSATQAEREAVLAQVGRLVARAVRD